MCRVVHYAENSTLLRLTEIVNIAFEVPHMSTVSPSYLSPELVNLPIGKKTPPVILTTNESLWTATRHLLDKKIHNLYASFLLTQQSDEFVTPCLGQKRKIINSVGGSIIDLDANFESCEVGAEEPLESCMRNKEFCKKLDAIEEHMRSSGKSLGKKPMPQSEVNLGMEKDYGSNCSGDDVEEIDVIPRGYDKDFLEPLLETDFGGSNAVDIMLEQDEDLVSQTLPEDDNHSTQTIRPNYCTQTASGIGCGQQNGASTSNSGHYNGTSQPSPAHVHQPTGETDIPPLLDDTLFPTSVIPDLDSGDENIEEGKTFLNKSECQIALAIYAIKNMFQFKQRRTTKTHVVVTCADLNCSWMVNARKMKDNDYYRINKALLNHTSGIETRSKFHKLAIHKVIAHVCQSKFSVLETEPKPKNLQQMVLEDLHVSTTYGKCLRANQTANQAVRGTEEESFHKIEEYLHVLNIANPNSNMEIKTQIDEDGVERFLYLFLAFRASIQGFKVLRLVIVLDGTHLTGKYKGVLLTASGQDVNFQIFPLAFAVVDAETDASWFWFLNKVKEIVPDSQSLAIISDRHQSIVYKLAKHGACIVHLARNFVSRFKNKGLANLVMKAGTSYRVKHFNNYFSKIRAKNKNCAKFLEEVGFKFWTRAYFPGNQYNLMTSNIAESLNNALRSARKGTVVDLIMFIQTMLMRWFGERREKAISHLSYTTPEVDRLVTRNMKLSKGSQVTSESAWSSEVLGLFGDRAFVQLSEKQCTCRMYDTLKIPCGHALIAVATKNLPYEPLIAEHYRTSKWEITYLRTIKPNECAGDIIIPKEIRSRELQPQRTRRPCGRPRLSRVLSTGEFPDVKAQRKCGRCGGLGHNKTSCKHLI